MACLAHSVAQVVHTWAQSEHTAFMCSSPRAIDAAARRHIHGTQEGILSRFD
jgi:hypothetical protein